ncbi:MAG: S-layer homology domain-containing protein [Thermoanaerobaculia bacterium]
MAALGVTVGCGDGAYCPANPVTRAQMAAFVTRAFELALYGP